MCFSVTLYLDSISLKKILNPHSKACLLILEKAERQEKNREVREKH